MSKFNDIVESRILEAGLNPDKRDVAVTIIQGGTSKNGYNYNQSVLEQISHLMEGAKAYADHPRNASDLSVRSVRDVVGFYHSPKVVTEQGTSRVEAVLHILESNAWLWQNIKEAVEAGYPNLIGLSVDIWGKTEGRGSSKEVRVIEALNSCDIVTKPSAGGAFQRILQDEGEPDMPIKEQAREINEPTPDETEEPTPVETDVSGTAARVQEAVQNGRQPAPPEAPGSTETSRILEELKLERSQIQLERKLNELLAPNVVKDAIRAKFANRIFEAGELESEFKLTRDLLASIESQGMIRGMGYEKPLTSNHITEAEKMQAAFDQMLGVDVPDTLKDIKGYTSIREAYIRVTGDTVLNGENHYDLGRVRIGENGPLDRITEADTTTASFSYLLGTSMNRRLLKDYMAWPSEWQKFVNTVPIRDFKQQTRVRFGHFGSLSTVPEDTAYTTLTLTDTAATYVPTKRGNLVQISRETIVNDDLYAIKQLPTKLAIAAAYTIAEFVYAFLSNNPSIYDGNLLFMTGAPHTNGAISSSLSSAAMQAAVITMREQANYAGKRLGLRPRFLVVPPELEFTAMVATKSAGLPGGNNNDINPMLGYVTPIVAPQLTAAGTASQSKWFMVADPMEIDTIEIGFVGGQMNPALFIQDHPLMGLNFTQDVISYKVRHEYGGAVVDYRGLYEGSGTAGL